MAKTCVQHPWTYLPPAQIALTPSCLLSPYNYPFSLPSPLHSYLPPSLIQCNLISRGPSYLGVCAPMNVSCKVSTNDTAPYKCTDLASNTSITGTLLSPTYRLGCEMPCDRFLDCSTVCECWSSCKTTEVSAGAAARLGARCGRYGTTLRLFWGECGSRTLTLTL